MVTYVFKLYTCTFFSLSSLRYMHILIVCSTSFFYIHTNVTIILLTPLVMSAIYLLIYQQSVFFHLFTRNCYADYIFSSTLTPFHVVAFFVCAFWRTFSATLRAKRSRWTNLSAKCAKTTGWTDCEKIKSKVKIVKQRSFPQKINIFFLIKLRYKLI